MSMNLVTISESDIAAAVAQATGIEGMSVDAGPGPLVEIFGESRVSRLEVDLWAILPKVGLTNTYFQEHAEWAIGEAIKSCRADILRLVEEEKRALVSS